MQRSALFILLLIVAPFAAASRAGAPYIDVSSYVKGFVRVNGNSLGRHWIFVPGRSSTPPRRGWLGGGMRFCFSSYIKSIAILKSLLKASMIFIIGVICF